MQKRIGVTTDKITGATSGQNENVVIIVSERDFDPITNDWASPEKTRKAFPSRKALHVEKIIEGEKTRVAITIFGNSFVEISEDSLKMDGSAWGTSPQDIVEEIEAILQG